jgi:hypothetical protein
MPVGWIMRIQCLAGTGIFLIVPCPSPIPYVLGHPFPGDEAA